MELRFAKADAAASFAANSTYRVTVSVKYIGLESSERPTESVGAGRTENCHFAKFWPEK